MNIDKFVNDDYCILTLRGEFDTFYVPSLQEEVESLLDNGISHLILNLRLVKFINSTALGAIIKFHRLCSAAQGQLVIAHPSAFVKDIIGKVGIDQLVPVFDDQDAAVRHIVKNLNALELEGAAPVNQESVMITFPDETRKKQVGVDKPIVGRMRNVNGERIQFVCSGEKYGLSPDQLKTLFIVGSDLHLKFQVKMFRKGFFELIAAVSEVEPSDDGVRVTARFTKISESDRTGLTQFARDLIVFKDNLPSKG